MKNAFWAFKVLLGIFISIVMIAHACTTMRDHSGGVVTKHRGIIHVTGTEAIWYGLLDLALAFGILGGVLQYATHKSLYPKILVAVWVGLATWQLLVGF